MKTKHAVLYYPDRFMPNTAIAWVDGKQIHEEELADSCYTLADLARVCYPRYITHLWVMPAYGEFEPMPGNDEWQFSPYYNRKKMMMGAAVRLRGHKDIDVNIIFPQYTSWWGSDKAPGWVRECSPRELLITLCYLEMCLGVTITGSPGRTGWNYLKKIHPGWVEEIPGVDLAACHFDKKAQADIIWERPLLTSECENGVFVHKFDKGAAYPYAGSKTDIGVGTPEHKDHGLDALVLNDKQSVGVWRCSIKPRWIVGSIPTPENSMPPVWKEDTNTSDYQGWLAGPIIRLLASQGHMVTVHEGWVFPTRHDVLAKWGKDLWDIRQGFELPKWVNRKCAKFAQQATKQIMNMTIGITAFKDFDDDDEMKRPDIRGQVIARHRELTWHNIEKIRKLYGVTPVIVYMDAVYYISSSNPDGRAFLPELVKREGQFGGYRWEGCIEMTPDVLMMFNQKLSEADRLEYLNTKGWQR